MKTNQLSKNAEADSSNIVQVPRKQRKLKSPHPLDPDISMDDVLAWVKRVYPNAGPKSQLATLLGTSKTLVTNWCQRDDGKMPAPWSYRFVLVCSQMADVLPSELKPPANVLHLPLLSEV